MSLRSETKRAFYLSELIWTLKSGNESTSQDLSATPKLSLAFAFIIAATRHSISSGDLDGQDLPAPRWTDVPSKRQRFCQACRTLHWLCVNPPRLQSSLRKSRCPLFSPSICRVGWCGQKGSAAAAAEPLGPPESCSPAVLQKATNVSGRWWSMNSKVSLFFPLSSKGGNHYLLRWIVSLIRHWEFSPLYGAKSSGLLSSQPCTEDKSRPATAWEGGVGWERSY